MNVLIVFTFLCVLKNVVSDLPSPRAYYGEHFLEFFRDMKREDVFLDAIFDNMEVIKNTSELCYQHLQTYRNSLWNNTYWAMRYVDSFGSSLEPGWLTGSSANLGAFDECVSEKANEAFRGNYCFLNVDLQKDDEKLPWFSRKPSPMVFTICVPHTCSVSDIALLTKPLEEQMNSKIEPSCQTARPSLSTIDYISIGFFVIVGLFTISTVLPDNWIPIRSNRFLEFWKCFDLYRNIRALSSSKKDENILQCLYGMRYLSQCCVIWAHLAFVNELYLKPVQNKFYYHYITKTWLGDCQVALTLSVDTFFLIGGTVISYNCVKRKTKLNLFKYYFHRYLRLTPALFVMILIVATFYNKLCSGPLCIIQSDEEHISSQKYWWTFVLYINNFILSCAIHTWYLAADWQLFMFVSPVVVIVINKTPQHIYKLCTLIFLVSLVYSATISIILNTPMGNFESEEEHDSYRIFYYMSPIVRAGPWVVGIFLGVFLNDYHIKQNILSKRIIVLGWGISAVTLVFCSCFFRFLTTQYPSLWMRVAFYTFKSHLFALAVAWIVFACSANIAGPVGKILSAPAFEPLGKLSYSMYLLHYHLIFVHTGNIRTPSFYSLSEQVPFILGIMTISTFAALPLYLTFEAPFMHIEKLIFHQVTDNASKAKTAALNSRLKQIEGKSKVNYKSCDN